MMELFATFFALMPSSGIFSMHLVKTKLKLLEIKIEN
jgi:hypothetical protein